jgi:hypothetical protein
VSPVFIRYYTEIPLPAATVTSALADDPRRWLPGIAAQANECAQALVVKVGFGSEPYRIGKLVEVELGEPLATAGSSRIPIRWQASGASGLFPALEADLEVASLGPDRTQLALSGTYEVPLGSLGRLADRTLLHRVAEATVKSFVDAVALQVSTSVLKAHRAETTR